MSRRSGLSRHRPVVRRPPPPRPVAGAETIGGERNQFPVLPVLALGLVALVALK